MGYQSRWLSVFTKELLAVSLTDYLLPLLSQPKFCIIHLRHNDLYLLGTLKKETPPHFALDFLQRVLEILQHYFKEEVTERSVKDHFTIVYQVGPFLPLQSARRV